MIQKNEQTQKVRNTNCFELLYTNILTSSDLNDLNKTLRSDGVFCGPNLWIGIFEAET